MRAQAFPWASRPEIAAACSVAPGAVSRALPIRPPSDTWPIAAPVRTMSLDPWSNDTISSAGSRFPLTPYHGTGRRLATRGEKAVRKLKSGELARQAGVNVETLRFYERKGLLPKPARGSSGHREYPLESVRLIRFIKRARELGFLLREIRELLALRVQPGVTCAEVRDKAEQKISEVRRRIADLKAIERALQKLTASCSGRGPATDCPILEHLDGEIL